MTGTGKKARRQHGNRHAAKRAKKRPGMTATYAAKRARWVALQRRGPNANA